MYLKLALDAEHYNFYLCNWKSIIVKNKGLVKFSIKNIKSYGILHTEGERIYTTSKAFMVKTFFFNEKSKNVQNGIINPENQTLLFSIIGKLGGHGRFPCYW